MKITNEWLTEKAACSVGSAWWRSQKESNALKVLKKLIRLKKLDWANWLIVRVMTRSQHLEYACFAAEQVLEIFEKKYPDDKRPRLAIEAVRRCINDDSPDAAGAAWAAGAAGAARAAAEAARAACEAAEAAGAAWAAARAAWAAEAAWAAGDAAGAAAREAEAAGAAEAARAAMQTKILRHGIKLLEAK